MQKDDILYARDLLRNHGVAFTIAIMVNNGYTYYDSNNESVIAWDDEKDIMWAFRPTNDPNQSVTPCEVTMVPYEFIEQIRVSANEGDLSKLMDAIGHPKMPAMKEYILQQPWMKSHNAEPVGSGDYYGEIQDAIDNSKEVTTP